MLISSPDLVLAVSRKGKKFGAKKWEEGGGEGVEETRSDKLRSRGPGLRPTQALRMPKFLVQIQDGGTVSF